MKGRSTQKEQIDRTKGRTEKKMEVKRTDRRVEVKGTDRKVEVTGTDRKVGKWTRQTDRVNFRCARCVMRPIVNALSIF